MALLYALSGKEYDVHESVPHHVTKFMSMHLCFVESSVLQPCVLWGPISRKTGGKSRQALAPLLSLNA